MGKPKMPEVPAVPPPPPAPPQLSSTQVASTSQAFDATAAAARGFAGTILTGPQGVDQGVSYPTKQLTGQ